MNNRYNYNEQQLIDEVIYLHSLWHQGPPSTSYIPNPIPPIPIPSIPIPYSEPFFPHNPIPTRFHHPLAPAHTRSFPFPPHTSKKRKKNKRTRRNPYSRPDPGIEWPCPPSPDPSPKGWAPFNSHSTTTVSLQPSSQEKEKLSALRSQTKASQAIKNFLINDSDEEDEDEDEDEDDYDLEEIEDLIVGIFMEDDEMRGYYQKCYESGEFCCFVCGAIGKKKSGKRYKDCSSLVQHSMSISRTVKKTAHRAFGQAVCKVLGWDIDRLPIIVIKGVPLGMKEVEGVPKENTDGDGNVRDGKVVEHAQGCSSKKGGDDIGLENAGGRAIDEVNYKPLGSGAEWVCENPPCDSSSTASGWPSFNTESSSQTRAVLAEAQTSVAGLQRQQHKALEACKEYLVGNAGSDCDNDTDNEDEDESIDCSDPVECEELKFFVRLFTEDSDLRRYYENNYEEGDFCCLVCEGVGKKMGKRFKGCVSLVQHSIAVKRTKRMRAHRAYSQVICKVLGWDFDRLPTIVLKGEPLGSSLAG
ncbi:hypothetical protein TanjilG_15175 [Lupinus angustifolius]|uniref:Uncharacterized protein n=1 Tax=Lupinus angustifolius TaxID=3871 RepID=A0A1J7H620_LUPAN|nr:hypothetical protein TanjilG_15175 [Lupinus angustifolius]